MISILGKELKSFFSSLIGYLVIATFLIFIGLFMWIFTDTSILDNRYASLAQLFGIAPMIFVFLIPAITMRSFSEEKQQGTIEFLNTKPIKTWKILIGKYLGNFLLVVITLIPTLIYVWSVSQLGAPKGNIDMGEVIGSYAGLLFLAGLFTAIGLFTSSLSDNQIVAFLIAAVLCFIFYLGFDYLSRLPIFFGNTDLIVQKIGAEYHYASISKGKIELRDVVYFITTTGFVLWGTWISVTKHKW